MKAVFMGLGYIGLPAAAVAAGAGITVLGVDVNPDVVATINRGKIHILEPALDALVKQAVEQGTLRASLEPETGDAFFIVVPIPFKQNHRADISFVESAARTVIPFLREGNLFVIESASPVLTTEKMTDLIFKLRPELKNKIYIAYCPERVLPGNVLYELEHNDRVIGGLNPESADKRRPFTPNW
jgi:UDP-N-acetyl-D-mannosaminuronic acid dehydrogenase